MRVFLHLSYFLMALLAIAGCTTSTNRAGSQMAVVEFYELRQGNPSDLMIHQLPDETAGSMPQMVIEHAGNIENFKRYVARFETFPGERRFLLIGRHGKTEFAITVQSNMIYPVHVAGDPYAFPVAVKEAPVPRQSTRPH